MFFRFDRLARRKTAAKVQPFFKLAKYFLQKIYFFTQNTDIQNEIFEIFFIKIKNSTQKTIFHPSKNEEISHKCYKNITKQRKYQILN